MSRKGQHHDKFETDSCRESRSYSPELEMLNKAQAISAVQSGLFSKQP